MKKQTAWVHVLWILVFSTSALAEKTPVWLSSKTGLARVFHDSETGKLSGLKIVAPSQSYDGFISMHPNKAIIYVLASVKQGEEIHAYAIDENNELALINKLEGLPSGAAHIQINEQGTVLAVSYYNSSSIGLYSLTQDGKLSHTIHQEKVSGSSVHPSRQKRSYPHGSVFNEQGNIAYFSDLGSDLIWAYKITGDTSATLLHKIKTPAGFGPRHIIFDKDYNFAYVTQELIGGVSVYKHNVETGNLIAVQHLNQVDDAAKELWANVSDLQIHPSGKFLYVVNRGFDQITAYRVSEQNGKLSFIENEPVRGSISRHIAISADGKWLLAAGANSGTLASFKINSDGTLNYVRSIVSVETPKAVFFGR
ncbi:lactonase family protein [Agaribacter flavus]|uniref:Lactonase family protein n=1 Tax=Agaribacter flavus TaxID=1902781 RepID=A0ABV7FR62_9ALTE